MALTDGYRDARNKLVATAALATAWSIGVVDAASGTVNFLDVPIKASFIKGTLLVVSGYFAAQVQIEWWLSDASAQANPTARFDLGMTFILYLVALAAVVLLSVSARLLGLLVMGFAFAAIVGVALRYLDHP